MNKNILEENLDLSRQLIELAIHFGKTLKSSETGLLHYHYDRGRQPPYQAIPLVENFLYALALLRSRTGDNISEGKQILENLLHFQNSGQGGMGKGNFPIYIHDFPVCKDRFLSLQVGMVLFWVYKEFHHVMGAELKQKLQFSLQQIIEHCLDTYQQKPGPYLLQIKLGSLLVSLGRLFNQEQYQEKGFIFLNHALSTCDLIQWSSSESIGQILSCLSMVYPKISESPWKVLWNFVVSSFHPATFCYVGPAYREWQKGFEPEVTLYEMFMGMFSNRLSSRVLKPSIAHLESMYAVASQDRFAEPLLQLFEEGSDKQKKWAYCHASPFCYCLVASQEILVPQAYEKGFHKYRCVWSHDGVVHTLVCQGGASLIDFSIDAQEVKMLFFLKDPLEGADRENLKEICLYLDAPALSDFLVDGKKASTFAITDPLCIQAKGLDIHARFEVVEGEGKFFGHRMMGNRPSQISAEGENRYNAYDWQFFVRTVSRKGECKILLTLALKNE